MLSRSLMAAERNIKFERLEFSEVNLRTPLTNFFVNKLNIIFLTKITEEKEKPCFSTEG